MHSYNSDEVARGEGLPRGVRDAMADPIVQALLAADRVDPRDVADLSRRMAAWLSHRKTRISVIGAFQATGSAGASNCSSLPPVKPCRVSGALSIV